MYDGIPTHEPWSARDLFLGKKHLPLSDVIPLALFIGTILLFMILSAF